MFSSHTQTSSKLGVGEGGGGVCVWLCSWPDRKGPGLIERSDGFSVTHGHNGDGQRECLVLS